MRRFPRPPGEFVKREGQGRVFVAPFNVVFSLHDVVYPDILYVSKKRASVVTENNVKGAPDLVVEVLSFNPPTHSQHCCCVASPSFCANWLSRARPAQAPR
ncbi:MAG: Uma2 family endonuclease [Terriglobia bacterium]